MVTAASLRALGADGLAALLTRRPDVQAGPPVADLSELAELLQTPTSMQSAMECLTLPALQLAEALTALGGQATDEQLTAFLGGRDISRAVAELQQSLLLTTDADELQLASTVQESWDRPLGLGIPAVAVLRHRTSPELATMAELLGVAPPTARKPDRLATVLAGLSDADLVRQVLAQAPSQLRHELEHVAHTGEIPEEWSYPRSFPTRHQLQYRVDDVSWALIRGLLVSDWTFGVHMPAEVALAVRGPGYRAPFTPDEPAVRRAPAHHADSTPAARELLRVATAVLDDASLGRLPMLKSGGIGVRELRRIAKLLHVDVEVVRLAISLAVAAGLLGVSDAGFTPTTSYDAWLASAPAKQFAELAQAWVTLGYAPLADSGAWAAAAADSDCVEARRALLAAWGSSADAVVETSELRALVAWRRPMLVSSVDTEIFLAAAMKEATLLGVEAGGALTGLGRALLSADPAALQTATQDLGEAETQAHFQSDLTAIVAGIPSSGVARLLDSVADREGPGSWRFSPASVRRALDGGAQADEVLVELRAASTRPLPQPLEYLFGDVARRFGAVRVAAAGCCLHSTDEALLREIVADRRLSVPGFRQLAPTVLVSVAPAPEALAALRGAGYAPAMEDAAGDVLLEKSAHSRTVAPMLRGSVATPRADPAQFAAELLARPDRRTRTAASSEAATWLATVAPQLPQVQRNALARAIDRDEHIAITYVNQANNPSSRTICAVQLTGNILLAYCHLRKEERMFRLDRIVSVTAAGDIH